MDFARCVALGIPWMLPGNCKRSKVLYIDWERRGLMFGRRLRQLAHGSGVVIDYMEARRSLADMVPEVSAVVHTRGYEFVIVDSLSIAMMGADMMAANEVIPAMFALHEIGVPILCLDHQKKLYEKENPWTAGAYGSIFKEAVASCVWQAGKVDPRTFTDGYMDFKLHHKKNNFDLAPKDIWIRLQLPPEDVDPLDARVTLSPLKNEESASPDSRIINMIGQRDPDPVTLVEIVAGTGIPRETARQACKRLHAAGLIYVAEKGGPAASNAYALTELGRGEGGGK